jgi:hypothetical protein
MSLDSTHNTIPEEQANVVPNKTIASRLREVHGTTGETIATAIPGAGPVMYVDAVITEVDGDEYYVLTKTFNEIKQAIDNNIFVVIKRKVNEIVYIEYIDMVVNSPDHDTFSVHAIEGSSNVNLSIVVYSTDNPGNYPKRLGR